MVVMAIIISISAVVFSSQSSFNKTLVLANTAYDVALSLRGAQMYGIGGRTVGTSPTGYGIHFTKFPTDSFTLFADTYPPPVVQSTMCHPITDASALDAQPGNCTYDSDPNQDVLVTKYTLGNNITVTDFCAYSGGTKSCASSSGGPSTLDIVFARPNPDPVLTSGGVYNSAFPVTSACITLSSPLGGSRTVSVSSSGRISVDSAACP